MKLLNAILGPADLKKIEKEFLPDLCDEIREYFIQTILQTGGHFAGNLGVVELTVALHYVFDFETDRLVWDVGHQSYIHKMITGRLSELAQIRNFGGISGFPKMKESTYDHFGTGHSSTSISATLGMATAALLKKEKQRKFVAVVGDGALTGGMSFEALNNVISSNANILILVNDNHIGIDPNTGAIDRQLQKIESFKDNIFQNFGLPYIGPIDGHNLSEMLPTLESIKNHYGPQVLHVKTIKGKNYPAAEAEQTKWHSTSKFVKISPANKNGKHKWQDIFADSLIDLATNFEDIVGITPAMPSGSGMIRAMEKFPDRFFDVGIAEQHAITFAAGLSTEGFIPFVNIYSTFLQRGYDQLIHDVALQNLPVVFCVDRAGLVGEDGPTHHGSFDIAFLRCIPNLIVSAPKDEAELYNLMYTAYMERKPFSIRYPKGDGFLESVEKKHTMLPIGKAEIIKQGEKLAILTTGIGCHIASQAESLHPYNVTVIHFPFIKPLDHKMLKEILQTHSIIISIEDGCIAGGFGEAVAEFLIQNNFHGRIKHLGIPDTFITHGDNANLYEECGYGPQQLAQEITHLMTS